MFYNYSQVIKINTKQFLIKILLSSVIISIIGGSFYLDTKAETINETYSINHKNLKLKIKKIEPNFTPRYYDFNPIKIDENKILFVGETHLDLPDEQGAIEIFDSKTNSCNKLKNSHPEDYNSGVVDYNGKIILT